MNITSNSFKNNCNIPSKYTCDGENINPQINFIDIPVGARSLVLIVDDPDAPSKTWVHWLLWNIPSTVNSIDENSVPLNVIKGINDFGKLEYGGPCPPSGVHRYFFKLYALDILIDLPVGATKSQLLEAIKDHVIEEAVLIGKYEKINNSRY